MKKSTKFYVVWKGRATGIFDNWPECQVQVDQFVGAQYKSYSTLAEAKAAFTAGPSYTAKVAKPNAQVAGVSTLNQPKGSKPRKISKPTNPALVVDAACSGVPGPVEWQGLLFGTGKIVFRSALYPDGTNNIGEFLGIVDGIRWLIKEKLTLPLYSDSRNAILWVKNKKCKTTMKRTQRNFALFKLIEEAEHFLNTTEHNIRVRKWETDGWGENPADFGRK